VCWTFHNILEIVNRFFSLEVEVVVTLTHFGPAMGSAVICKNVELFHGWIDRIKPTLGGTESAMEKEDVFYIPSKEWLPLDAPDLMAS
jgi:hypothetical protein